MYLVVMICQINFEINIKPRPYLFSGYISPLLFSKTVGNVLNIRIWCIKSLYGVKGAGERRHIDLQVKVSISSRHAV